MAQKDDVKALSWYRSAADQDYGPAQRNLAEMYAEGSPSVPRDHAWAAFWMKRAAVAGDSVASGLAGKLESELPAADKRRLQTLETQWAKRGHIREHHKRSPGWLTRSAQ